MADFKYIMQGFQKDINFFDEIKEVLETEDYTSICYFRLEDAGDGWYRNCQTDSEAAR